MTLRLMCAGMVAVFYGFKDYIMKTEDIDLEEMFEKETGKEWAFTRPDIYTDWLEEKLKEQIVKNSSIPVVMNTEESLNKMNSSEAIWLIESKKGHDVYKGGKCLISGASEEDLNKLHINV